MPATVHLDEPVDDRREIECAEARIGGETVRAIPDGDGPETVVPLSNVAGVVGEDVTREVEEIEVAGGRVTEVVTHVS